MATNTVPHDAAEGVKAKRHRSPNFPTVGLKEAIERAERFLKADGKAGASPEIAAKHLGFASAHGAAMSVLAALKRFGLVEDRDGRVVPTQRAIEIISLPKADARRLRAIREAASMPSIYTEILEQYKATGLPHDETLEGELVAYKGFSPNGAKEFLKGFKETLEFAGLSDFSVLGSEKKVEEEGEKKSKVGDWVQWEHNGVLGFPESKRLTGFSDDGKFAFVEGYKSGLPTSEVIPADPPEPAASRFDFGSFDFLKSKTGGFAQGAKMRQDVFSLAEGEAIIHWPTPLSDDSIKDLEDWLELVKRKIKRSAAEPSEKTTD